MLELALSLWTGLVYRALGARRFRQWPQGSELVVHELGAEDGEPWVLLHGLGSTGLSWHAVASDLRRDCRILVPELSRLGGSRVPEGGLNVAEAAAAAAGLIAQRFPGRAVTLGGISLGGWVAVRLALERPELVERLLLVNAAGYRNQDWERIAKLVEVRTLADVDRIYDAIFVRPPLFLRLVRLGFLRAYRSRSVRRVIETIRPEDGFGAEDLARLEMPVGLIWGELDGLFRLEVGRAGSLPRGELIVLPGCGHAVHWENPAALAAAVRTWRDNA